MKRINHLQIYKPSNRLATSFLFQPLLWLLRPFSWLYGFIINIRNRLYDNGLRNTITFGTFTLSVGNLTVGGTGKTPHVEYLIRLLKDRYPVATLSRGYGRRTKGFRLADKNASAETIGDEPMQFYEKFSKWIAVAVGEKRTEAVPKLLAMHPDTQVIILDDAYQHRSIGRHLNLLLTDYNRLFINDLMLPLGRLREPQDGAKRADGVVVTKCLANISQKNIADLKTELKKYFSPKTLIFFSGIRYGVPEKMVETNQQEISAETSVLLVSGLANADLLEDYVAQQFRLVRHLRFGDHYSYTQKDLAVIESNYKSMDSGNNIILTTEKDKVKLKPLLSNFTQLPFYYLPIEVYFLEDAETFDNWVLDSIQAHYEQKNV